MASSTLMQPFRAGKSLVRSGASSALARAGSGNLPCTCASLRRYVTSLQSEAPSHQLSQQPLSSTSSSASSTLPAGPATSKATTSYNSSSALRQLASQPSHYIVASLYQRRFLLTPRDLLTVPRLKDVSVGDVVTLDKIHEVGSRDFTMRASEGEVLPKEYVQCRATVVEHTKAQMQRTVKFKRRKGYKKTIKTKPPYTRLRIGDIVIGQSAS